MGITTNIEWCDSTLNLQMGCAGCELWNAKSRHCYAGQLTERYAGKKGWPEAFYKPALFPERLTAALKWPDLTGKDRPDKPWLNGLPRMVFLNDMGDTFTEGLPVDWLAPFLPKLADSPHVYMVLTKRASRMVEFSRQHPFPDNVWPGVSVTTQETMKRAMLLAQVYSGGVHWLSVEPLLGPVNLDGHAWPPKAMGMPKDKTYPGLVIAGGESGHGARPCNLDHLRSVREQCKAAGVAFFCKQDSGPNPGMQGRIPDVLWNVKEFPNAF